MRELFEIEHLPVSTMGREDSSFFFGGGGKAKVTLGKQQKPVTFVTFYIRFYS